MWWAIFGGVLLLFYFFVFALLFVGGTADDNAIDEYERYRAECDRMFR